MNILSLFDGISIGKVALEKAGIKIDNYFASEIDEYAIKISKKNHTDIKHIGNILKCSYVGGWLYGEPFRTLKDTMWHINIDLLIGGSPCQGFSSDGKGLNFEDSRSKLFFEYVRLLKKVKPKYFLLENVNMKPEWEKIITDILGVEPVKINSKLFVPQSRPRTYWTNIDFNTKIKQKEYKLSDIIEDEPIEPKYISENAFNSVVIKKEPGSLLIKNGCKKGYIEGFPGDTVDIGFIGSKYRRGRVKKKYLGCLVTQPFHCIITNDLRIRYITPEESESAQGLDIGYTEGVSKTQRYKLIGNGWEVNTLTHIFKGLK